MTATQSTALARTNGGNGAHAVAISGDTGRAMESLMIEGDLSKLTPVQRLDYYRSVCTSLGLNPLTQPFAYLKLSGKLTLYAKRDAADQLRKINGVSVEILEKKSNDGFISVHVRAKTADGRQDEDLGIVAIKGLSGEAAANAILKAVTKAKRRVTLSICGLGWLDETEIDSIPGAQPIPAEDGLYADQDGYLAHFEEEIADMDAAELAQAWAAHQTNSQHRLDAAHAMKALRLYEAAQKRIATTAKE